MNGPLARLGAVSLGCSLLVLIVSCIMSYRTIAALTDQTISEAVTRSLLLPLVGGSGLAVLLLLLPTYLVLRRVFSPTSAEEQVSANESQDTSVATPADVLSGQAEHLGIEEELRQANRRLAAALD